MGDQVEQGDLFAQPATELRNDLHHPGGERQLPELDRAQRQDVGERLGQGENTEDRVDSQRPGLLVVGAANCGLEANPAVACHDDDGSMIETALDVGLDVGSQVRQPRLTESRVAHDRGSNKRMTYRLSMYSRMA